LVIFIFSPAWLCFVFGILLWFLPVSIKMAPLNPAKFTNVKKVFKRMKEVLTLEPFFVSHLTRRMPGLEKINENIVVITQPNLSQGIILEGENQFSGSLKHWVWACAVYLLEKNTIVYNGLPSTEAPAANLAIPQDLKVYSIFDTFAASKPHPSGCGKDTPLSIPSLALGIFGGDTEAKPKYNPERNPGLQTGESRRVDLGFKVQDND
jgi:hypothetical protein